MRFFLTSQIREIDSKTIEREPIASIDLMERAAESIFRWIVANYSSKNSFSIFAGNGNNGGDGVALARMLAMVGYNVNLYTLETDSNKTKDLETNILRAKKQGLVKILHISNSSNFPSLSEKSIVIDALFGSGLTRPLEGIYAELVTHINKSNSTVISIDIPSGLFGERNPFPNPNPVVKATVTLTLQFPKLSFFFAENYEFTGHWEVLPIGLHESAIKETPSHFNFVTSKTVNPLLQSRSKFGHKGTYGHALLIAGSYGMMGAAVLATKACLASGVGLLTVHVPKVGYNIIQSSVPEALVEIDQSELIFTDEKDVEKFTAIGIGPGLGKGVTRAQAIKKVFEASKKPMVIDADALNIISENTELLSIIPKNSIITPHPGEFDRLFGKSECGSQRFEVAQKMSAKYNIIIVLKGAFTQIFTPNGDIYFNSTGNPGMAAGGSGDVLTGLTTGLLAQNYSSLNASLVGVYIHGLAGDMACFEMGANAMVASDIISYLGKAFLKTKNNF